MLRLSGYPTQISTATIRLVLIQLAIASLVSIICYLLNNIVLAYSVLLGSVLYVVPNLHYIWCAFIKTAQKSPQSMLKWLCIGEAIKLILTLFLFAACFALIRPLHIAGLFIAYLLMIITNLAGVALLIEKTKI